MAEGAEVVVEGPVALVAVDVSTTDTVGRYRELRLLLRSFADRKPVYLQATPTRGSARVGVPIRVPLS